MESFRAELVNFIERDKLDQKNIDQAVELSKIKPSGQVWQVFINNVFLLIGSVALGLSCIFFLAFNWSEFGRFAKFSLVEVALVASIIVYLKTQIDSMASSATLLCSTLLLGGLMALVGQTYQTGADPWQLFFYWAVLMLPWALIARFTSIWLIWLGLIIYALSVVMWIWVLSKVDLSVAYPFVGMGFIITMIFGILVLNENVTLMRVSGTTLIMIGCILVGRSA